MPRYTFVEEINSAAIRQQKYANASGRKGPQDLMTAKERYSFIIEMLGHLTEEAIESRMEIPRRAWRNDEEGYLDNCLPGNTTLQKRKRDEFLTELVDCWLFLAGTLAYGGFSGEEFEEALLKKIGYNAQRPNHKYESTLQIVSED